MDLEDFFLVSWLRLFSDIFFICTGGGYNIFWEDEDQRLEVYRGRNAGQWSLIATAETVRIKL
jgi:hypothetical protein